MKSIYQTISRRGKTGCKQLTGSSISLRLFFILLCALSLVVSCGRQELQSPTNSEKSVTLRADGNVNQYVTTASSVREFLEERDVNLAAEDIVDPPLFTPLEDGEDVVVTRVTEETATYEQAIAFKRRIVRNESMGPDDPPRIIQAGKPGLREATIRIIYHDGLEVARLETQFDIIEQPQDEIVMIGVGATANAVDFPGLLAYLDGGNSVLLRGTSASPQQLQTGNNLDHRVFSLSPSGSHLLYTKATTETEKFNELWVFDIGGDNGAVYLGVDNVLWAGWNPAAVSQQQIAFTTGNRTEQVPGWEANNDLWIGNLPQNLNSPFRPRQLVESYPATYSWWGGNYTWSPDGQTIAYSHADEVGLIDVLTSDEDQQRRRLLSFTEYNTRSEWVWVPSISWSPDSQFLAVSLHSGEDPDLPFFDTWAVYVPTGRSQRLVENSGIWGHPFWSNSAFTEENSETDESLIAFLRAVDPLDSLRSSYTLWIMDRDGSNKRQLYPETGENSQFPRTTSSIVWGPRGQMIAFVFEDALHIVDAGSGQTWRITQDDNIADMPTWAPYGSAISSESVQIIDSSTNQPETTNQGIRP